MLRVTTLLCHFPRVIIGLGQSKYNFCPTKMAQVRYYNANDKRKCVEKNNGSTCKIDNKGDWEGARSMTIIYGYSRYIQSAFFIILCL